MSNIVIVGAAGRMGRILIGDVMNDESLTLHGATEIATCSLVGQDSGIVAGCGKTGVTIVDSLDVVLPGAEVIIDFSFAEVALDHARKAVAAGVSVVLGTTGLTAGEKAELEELGKCGKIVYAPNMSVGINVLFHLCEQASKVLKAYDVEIVETHHRLKKDAPSGTALGLAEAVCLGSGQCFNDDLVYGREGMVGARTDHEIGIHAVRGGDIVGDHTVMFMTGGERIELTHKASSRQAFTSGSLKAAKFLATVDNGLYNMRDVLGLD